MEDRFATTPIQYAPKLLVDKNTTSAALAALYFFGQAPGITPSA
jgi:hypothetical protein